MQEQINILATKVAGLAVLQGSNHKENRKDIHILRNAQQDLMDALIAGLDKIADKIGDRMDKIANDVVDLKVKYAKAYGYAIGVAAASAVVFQLVKWGLTSLGVK